jgi:hypothetical protein
LYEDRRKKQTDHEIGYATKCDYDDVEKVIADEKMLKARRRFRLSVNFPILGAGAGAY